MKYLSSILISVVIALLIIFLIKQYPGELFEGWYPTMTYVNTPLQQGVYNYRPSWNRWGWNGGWNRGLGGSWNKGWNGGGPVPVSAIRWGGLFGPMLTSLRSPRDRYIGAWVEAGNAYTDNPNDFTFVTVQQLNLDPARDFFRYRVRTKDGQLIPLNIQRYGSGINGSLEDGDRFRIPGMEGKGDFIFNQADKYSYVYV